MSPPAPVSPGPRGKGLLAYLMLTAMASGAMVMVIEVLGSRVVGPFFGVSLFVWTSLISVTLIALAAGYAAGGVLADRCASAGMLYAILLAAGLLVLLVPLAKVPVLTAARPLGLRAGAFTATLVLFGPPLFLLGCVSPCLVKLAARALDNIGRTVGGFYALSTVGSVLGTLLTGFVLIAHLGVDRIFTAVGTALILLAAGYFLVFRRRWAVLAVLLAPWLVPAGETVHTRLMSDGTEATLVAARDSFYGAVKVVDYRFGAQRTRELVIDGLVQGGVDPANGLPIYDYFYHLEQIPYGLNPTGRRCLVIGLGAGLIPKWYEARGIRTDVVEIDPVVVAMARDHFGFDPQGEVFVDDARHFLATATARYDFVLLDVFSGDLTPVHLLSLEALRQARARMRPGAVLAVNLIASLGPDRFMTASVVRTLEAVFERVDTYTTFRAAPGATVGNLIVVAYDGPPRTLAPAALVGFPVHPIPSAQVFANLGRTLDSPSDDRAVLLTDDYNPMDFYDAELRESVRRHILDNTHPEILLGSR